MSALDRLKAPVLREDTDLAIVNRHDLATLIAVAEAAKAVCEVHADSYDADSYDWSELMMCISELDKP